MQGDMRVWMIVLGCAFIGWILFDAKRKRAQPPADLSSLSLDESMDAPVLKNDPKKKSGPSAIVALTVLANDPAGFDAQQFHHLIHSLRLNWSDRGFYHRHYASDPSQIIEFTVTSLVEPGSFLTEQGELKPVPGVVLFMGGFTQEYTLRAFDEMIMVSKMIADRLGGYVANERRQLLTIQALESLKQQIIRLEKQVA